MKNLIQSKMKGRNITVESEHEAMSASVFYRGKLEVLPKSIHFKAV